MTPGVAAEALATYYIIMLLWCSMLRYACLTLYRICSVLGDLISGSFQTAYDGQTHGKIEFVNQLTMQTSKQTYHIYLMLCDRASLIQ